MAVNSRALADYNEPLTAEEQKFAAEHHNIIYKVLHKYSYDIDEYYGIAAISYLQAVKSYLNIERLRVYSFTTVAFRVISGGLYHCKERKIDKASKDNIYVYDYGSDEPDFDFLESIADSRDKYKSVYDRDEIRQIFSVLEADERELFRLKSQGYAQSEIAAICGGISQSHISRKMQKAREKIKSYLSGEKNDRMGGEDMGTVKIDYEEVKLLYEQGMSDGEIASQLKCSVYSIKSWRQSLKLPLNETMSNGESKVGNLVTDKRVGLLMKLVNPDDEPEIVKLFSDLTMAVSNQQIRRHFKQYGKEAKS